jgi:hypothetical protein
MRSVAILVVLALMPTATTARAVPTPSSPAYAADRRFLAVLLRARFDVAANMSLDTLMTEVFAKVAR